MNRFRPTQLLLAGTLFLAPLSFIAGPASAHAQSAPATRNVTGSVVDKSGAKVKGAVVHLKDSRSLAQRSYITADDGEFRFAQLSTSTDYEVWATLNDQRSDSKSISSFDTKKTQDIKLKMP